jgi:hypothetical protein
VAVQRTLHVHMSGMAFPSEQMRPTVVLSQVNATGFDSAVCLAMLLAKVCGSGRYVADWQGGLVFDMGTLL